MRKLLVTASLIAIAAVPALAEEAAKTPAPAAAETAAPVDPNVAGARAAIKGLGGALKEKLQAAMKEGGPVAALSVCNTEAPKIEKERSEASGMKVARTALKVRNPDNAPDDFERRVMEEFLAKIKGGADAMKLEHAEVVEKDGRKTFRYMKPIMTAGNPCLACHGAELKPEVSAKISELYPKDEAVGFAAGDMRGAFTVSRPLE